VILQELEDFIAPIQNQHMFVLSINLEMDVLLVQEEKTTSLI